MNCSKDFTPRLWLWSTVRWGALNIESSGPQNASAPEVVFESIWRDLDAVKVAFGDAWQQSHLPEGYSALMTAHSVHHFFVTRLHRTRDLLIRQRTQLINALRAHLAELGLVAAKGREGLH